MKHPMDTHKLTLFCILARVLNFNKAARQCHISAPTLSRTIQQLEEEVGVKLFTRDNRSVSLTAEGVRFLGFAQDTLNQWEAVKEELLAESSMLKGSLGIYCSVTASYSFLYDILADFRKDQPHIEITLHTGDPALAMERLLAGSEDVAIAARQQHMPRVLDFKTICMSSLTLIAPTDEIADRHADSKNRDWNQTPFILPERGVTRERLEKWFGTIGIAPPIYAQVAGHEAIVSLVSLGFGYGLVPTIVLDNSPLKDRVRKVTVEGKTAFGEYEVGVCVLSKRLKNPIIREFWSKIGG